MRIFGDGPRTAVDSIRHAETLVDYLDRSARPEMVAMRDVWETWFARYPQEPALTTEAGAALRKALRGRLRSRLPRQQIEAFWELYLHESLVRGGCGVRVRPDTPDFEVSAGNVTFQLEATVRGDSNEGTAAGNRIAALRDGLDRTQTGPWVLEVSADIESSSSPPIAALRRRIEEWLRGLDVAAARDAAAAKGPRAFDFFPRSTFEVDGYCVHVRAYPLRDGLAGPSDGRAVRVWGGPVVHVHNAEPLRDSLESKARAVRDLPGPIVVAVLLDRSFGNDEHVDAALFGTEQLDVTTHRDSGLVDARARRGDDGFWTAGGHGRRIDAVLSATAWDPARISRNTPTLWWNPGRMREAFDVPAVLPWRRCWVDDAGSVRTASGPSPAAFFGLSPSWPE